jgi:hypothetical protein
MTLIERINAVLTSIAKDITNNTIMLPRKIGASQRWYQSGLRHGAEYPYPYVMAVGGFTSGAQYFVPFTALEDATITALEIYCTNAQANATISLGIYASDSNNDVAAPLFTSNPISCSTVGDKNAPCKVQIKKGKVYWLSSLHAGTANFFRTTPDLLFAIKGATAANQFATIGYYTTNNTSMTQSAPTNKIHYSAAMPRVMFITG